MEIFRRSLFLFFGLVIYGSAFAHTTVVKPEVSAADIPRITGLTIIEPLCYGQRGTVKIDSVDGGIGTLYFVLDGVSTNNNPELNYVTVGEHTLTVEDEKGNRSDTTFIMTSPEQVRVELVALSNPIKANEPVYLQAVITPPQTTDTKFDWRPPQLFNDQNSPTQSLFLKETTNIHVTLTYENGCTVSDQLRVLVDDRTVYLPNAFIPGSDQNAYFTIYTGGGVTNVLSLKIFDRWGKPVFEKQNFPPNDPLLGWDGQINGKLAPSGTYLYVAQIEFFDGKQEAVTGDLTVAPNK